MRRFLAAAFIASGCMGFAQAAKAAPILHDSAAAFATITYTAGTNSTRPQVDPSRQIIDNMFDNSTSTILSLGLGGSISFLIGPTSNAIATGTVFELTNLGSGHKEQARIFLGTDLAGWIEIGRLLNQELGSTVTNLNPAVASLAVTTPGAATGFTLTVLDGVFNSIRLVDASPTAGFNLDGFDIATFSVTSNAPPPVVVPEPGAWLLLAAGLAGLMLVRVRRQRA